MDGWVYRADVNCDIILDSYPNDNTPHGRGLRPLALNIDEAASKNIFW